MVTAHFPGDVLVGALIGAVIVLCYHARRLRSELRQHYVRLSLQQSEIETLVRRLELLRLTANSSEAPGNELSNCPAAQIGQAKQKDHAVSSHP